MATSIKTIIESEYRGRGFSQAIEDLFGLESISQRTGISLETLAGGTAVVASAMGVMAKATDVAIKSIQEGAELEFAEERFDKLAASIGTTADALQGDMVTATRGMVSDAKLLASATDIINLGLGKSHDKVVRLASVVGGLGLDMNQLTLTLANDSTQRLDSLGLSVEGVAAKMEELERQGVSTTESFDLAVLVSLEEKLDLVGASSDSAAANLKILQASYENVTNAFSSGAAKAAADELSVLGDAAGDASRGLEVISDAAGQGLVNALVKTFDPMGTTRAFLVALGRTADESGDSVRTFGRTSAQTAEQVQKLETAVKNTTVFTEYSTRATYNAADSYDRWVDAAHEMSRARMDKIAADTEAKAEADRQAAIAAEEHAAAMQRQQEELARVNATTGDYFTTISASGDALLSMTEYGLQAADAMGANALQLAAYTEQAGIADDASKNLAQSLGQAAADAAAADFARTGDLDAYMTRLQELQSTIDNFPTLDKLFDQQNRVLPQMEEDPFFRIKEDTPAAIQLLEEVTTAGVTGFGEMRSAAETSFSGIDASLETTNGAFVNGTEIVDGYIQKIQQIPDQIRTFIDVELNVRGLPAGVDVGAGNAAANAGFQ